MTMHDQVRDLVASLPSSPRLSDVVHAVAGRVGKPVRVVDVDGPSWGGLTALVAQHDHEAMVLVPTTAPPLYRMHCVLHELGHLVHGDTGAAPTTQLGFDAWVSGGHVCQRSLDDGPGLVGAGGADEHFAEAFAYDVAQVLLAGTVDADERTYG
jgi:hypothetical protein